jgi:hypothetical protein
MRGVDVKGLVLIDSPSPVNHEPLPAEIISSITRSTGRPGSTSALEEEFLSNASLLGRYIPEGISSSISKTLKTVILQGQDTLDTETLCGVRYGWLNRQEVRDAAIEEWEQIVGGPVKVLLIEGNHFEPFMDDKVCYWCFTVTFADILTQTTDISNSLTALEGLPVHRQG